MDSCTSKQSSRQCQDRWSAAYPAPRFAWVLLSWVGEREEKHLTFIPLFIPNFPSFRKTHEIPRLGTMTTTTTTTNHHNEFAISIFGTKYRRVGKRSRREETRGDCRSSATDEIARKPLFMRATPPPPLNTYVSVPYSFVCIYVQRYVCVCFLSV